MTEAVPKENNHDQPEDFPPHLPRETGDKLAVTTEYPTAIRRHLVEES
jgi:ATP phosphoribosyltransferase